jgi:hypothetical protein
VLSCDPAHFPHQRLIAAILGILSEYYVCHSGKMQPLKRLFALQLFYLSD